MREIATHKINPVNDKLVVEALDGPGPGGASHLYRITLPSAYFADLIFQNGPIAEAGINGITHEALLAILIDRLEGFQGGPFKSQTNGDALYHLREALKFLHSRTKERMSRGVEGTHTP
jgi:hypothetical protein